MALIIPTGGNVRPKQCAETARFRGWHVVCMVTDMTNLRLAIRLLARNPVFAVIAILTLALGIGANTAIFSVIQAVLLRPLPYQDSDRLMMISENKNGQTVLVAGADLLEWQKHAKQFDSFAFWPEWRGSRSFMLPGGDRAELLEGVTVPSDFFKVMRAQPILGRVPDAKEDVQEGGPLGVMLSYSLWQRRFSGDSNIIGKSVTLDQFWRRQHTVLGIMPPGFNFPDKSELWVTKSAMEVNLNSRFPRFKVVARLKPDADRAAALSELNTIQSRTAAEHPEAEVAATANLVPIIDYEAGPQTRPALLLLFGAVAFLLLIACANVANLLLARGAGRQKEMAIRLALGASRKKILSLLITEGALLAILGAAAGLILSSWGVQALIALGGQEIPGLSSVRLNGTTLAFTLVISSLAAIFFGLAPSTQFFKASLESALREESHSSQGKGQNYFRSTLVVAELALTVLLLAGAGLMLKSFSRLQNVPLGFNPDKIITAEFDLAATNFYSNGRDRVFFDQLRQRVQAQPGVEAVSGGWYLPVIGQAQPVEAMTIETGNRKILTSWNAITPGYFETIGASIVKGRNFAESDGPRAHELVLINETAARRFFPGQNPLGQRLAMGAPGNYRDLDRKPHWREIIGVVRDLRPRLDIEPFPEAYFDYRDWPWHRAFLVVRTKGEPELLAAAIQKEVVNLNPDQPISSMRTMNQIIGRSTATLRFRSLLLTVFSGAALLLSAVGLYGVISYLVSQRTREFGIRMALGARAVDLLNLVLKKGMALVGLGVILGLAGALACARILQRLLYGVEATDTWALSTGAILLALIAFLACLIPARRAARLNPNAALRHE